MKKLNSKQQIISTILKLTTIVCAILGIVLSFYDARDSFMGGVTVFMYFTIQSNIAIALIGLIGLFMIFGRKNISNHWYVLKFVGTISITLTGLVFCFVLAPTLPATAWKTKNVLTHVVVPISAILDFFVVGINGRIAKWKACYVVVPPALYVVYAGVAYANQWQFGPNQCYPYFFLNWGSPAGIFGFISEKPYMGCGWWILALFFLLLILGFLYLLIVDGLRKILEG